jgi:hypothetical protein
MRFLLRLSGLLTALAFCQLTSCTTASPAYWQGFHGPAYLPARPVHRPVPTSAHRLDSLTSKWPATACQQRGRLPR